MPIYFNDKGLRLADAPVAEAPASEAPAENSAPTEEDIAAKASKTEQMRMMDAVRDAAREYDTPTEADIQEFIAGRAKDPSKVDIAKFLEMTLDQRQSDLVDLLDAYLRQHGPLKRGRRKVRVSAPRGYLRRLMDSMDSDSIAQVTLRLQSRGHGEEDLNRFFGKKFNEETMGEAAKKKAEMSDSDNWEADGLFFNEDWNEEDDDAFGVNPVEMAKKIASNIPQPVVNVTVEAPKKGKTVVKRDPSTGLIESVEQEDAR